MTPRPATAADVDELVRVINLAYRVEVDIFHGDRTSVDDVRERLTLPNATFLAIDDGRDTTEGPRRRLAGAVYVETRGDRGYFGMLSVDPAHQRRGLGRVLVRAAESFARARGCTHMDLDVVHLRAELPSFYGSLGYTATGAEPYADASQTKVPVNLVRMTKPLGDTR